MPTIQNQNLGGYMGTGQTGTIGGVTYNPATAANPYGSYTTPPTPTIPASTLTSAVKPLALAPVVAPTYGGLPGATEAIASVNQVTAQTDAQKQAAIDAANLKNDKSSLDQTLQQILGVNMENPNNVDRTAQDAAKKQSDLYTSQLEQEQLANRRAIEDMRRNNPGGTFGGALEGNIAVANRESLSKQADIAILQTSANRNFDTAAAIADRQVQMKLEEKTNKLNALKYFYENNKADFDKAEGRAYAEKIKIQDAELKKQTDIENAIKDMKLNVAISDAPNKNDILTKLGNAKTLDEALKIAGKYGGDYLKQDLLKAQIANQYADLAKTKAETNQLKTGVGGKPPTDAQVQAAGFADRIKQSNDIIDAKADTFKKMNYVDFKLAASTSQLANSVMSPEVRQAAQAMRNFVTAKLRKESGAAISQSEFDDARVQYFPALGDDEQTLAQKKQLRESVLNNLVLGSGGTYNPTPPPNPFSAALGQSSQTFQGTSILAPSSSGGFNFVIPK